MSEAKTIADVVCPKCFKPVFSPAIDDTKADRYGSKRRGYYGWCFDCEIGFEVIQFKQDGHWVINEYKKYVCGDGRAMPIGPWITLNDLPGTPLVVFGPGGDYDRQVYPDDLDRLSEVAKNMSNAINLLGHVVRGIKERAQNDRS